MPAVTSSATGRRGARTKAARKGNVLVLLTILAVLSAELFNTAVESLVDLVTDDYAELAKAAKDVAAGAVLLCAFFAVVIGCAVYGPHLWMLFFGLHGS